MMRLVMLSWHIAQKLSNLIFKTGFLDFNLNDFNNVKLAADFIFTAKFYINSFNLYIFIL
jgi:hypothetical protein